MKFQKYSNKYLINEATTEDKINIVVLSNTSEESYTLDTIKKECKNRNVECFIIDVNTHHISESNDKIEIKDKDGKQKIEIDPEYTAILTRRGVVRNTHTKGFVEKLENLNFFVVNTLDAILNCENKWTTTKLLENNNIPTPRTALVYGEESIESAIKSIGGKYPVVLKLLSGSHGIGVSVIESYASLRSVLQTIWKIDDNIETLIQEMIESDFDLRIHTLIKRFNKPIEDDENMAILGAMRRNKIENDFRTNYSLGGTTDKAEITEEQEKLALEAAKAVGTNWAGVDIIVDKKTGKNYVLEVNSSPGTKGLLEATGVDVVSDIVEYLIDKNNWIRSRRVVGFRESINIPGIGDVIAKFDTGNGSLACSMTYDEMDLSEDSKIVKWSLGDKKFTSDVIDTVNAEVGDHMIERPVIELDIDFSGKLYKNVRVALQKRDKKSTKFLVNRKFMERLGVSVNPYKAFVLSKFDGEYSPRQARREKHMGIKFE